jgi:hypothetical protein
MTDIEKRISSDSCIVCISTENQTVNVLPVLQYDIKNVIILSTSRADNAGWTKRMKDYLDRLQKNTQVQRINNEVEGNINLLSEFIYNLLKDKKSVVFNISGGQKIHFLGLYDAFLRRSNNNDLLCYVNGNTYEIIFYDIDRNMHKDEIRNSIALSLETVLNLYGQKSVILREQQSKTNPSEVPLSIYPVVEPAAQNFLEIGQKAYRAFLDHRIFRELFYGFGKPAFTLPDPDSFQGIERALSDYIKNTVNSQYSKILKSINSEGFQLLINYIYELFEAIDNGDTKKINELRENFSNYDLAGIKNDIVNQMTLFIIDTLKRGNNKPIISEDMGFSQNDIELLESIIKDIGGKINKPLRLPIYKYNIRKLSTIESPGFLFEWMVAAYVYDCINKSEELKKYINSVNMNVSIANIDDPSDKPSAELDLVITTKIGALIILEMKTYKLKADTAKSKEYTAKRSSGSYGTSIMVSPMLSSDKNKTKAITNITLELRSQEQTALRNNIKFWFFDEIKDKLPKEIMPKGK